MAYRVKLGANLGKEIRRLLTAQIGRAVAHLSGAVDDGGSAIHATRKSLKRCRSVLRLAKPALSRGQFRTYDHAVRDIARLLSHDRDREVMLETLDRLLKKASGGTERDALNAALTELGSGNINGFGHSAAQKNAEQAIQELQELEHKIDALAFRKTRLSTIAEGFAETYADAKTALKSAYRTADDEAFHAYRKALQHHWRHCQILAPLWPELMEVRVAAAREQSQLIGLDHDLSLITAHFRRDGASRLDAAVLTQIRAAATAEQARLRAEARPLARRLFALPPADMERLVRRLWPAAKAIAREQRRRGTTDGPPGPLPPLKVGPAG